MRVKPTNVVRAALDYATQGWSVFPLDGKRPIPGTHGHRDATTDEGVIQSWWREYPNANVGIACSSAVGPIVLDVDGPEGVVSLGGLKLPRTLEATSGRKDRKHLYFAPAGVEVRRMIKVRPGLDILGDGGYVVAPPSIHPKTGRPYRWLNDHDLALVPDVLLRLAKVRQKKVTKLPEILGEGERDDLLTSLAGSMRRRGASEDAILAALREENERRCRPPLSDRQINKIARSIAQKTPAPNIENLTDLGNARRFINAHHRNVRHVRSWRHSWVVWEGVRWAPDETGEVERLAKNTIRAISREAAHIEDDKIREAMIKHAQRSESASRVRGMLELASTEPEMVALAERFDADPWLINLENGTLNLRDGELGSPEREHFITKIAPAIFDEKAKAPTWMRFLRDVTNDNEELIRYLQRAVGYSLSGDVREQCLFFCYGSGQNGKSTFLEVVRELFGDYAQQAEFSTFLSRKNDGPRNDLARMRGTRLVTAVEASADRSFDEAVLKQLTGGDTVTARRLYEEYFEFQPTHKLWLAANHKPVVTEQTEAFWRRIRLIPFTVYIPPEKRDRALRQKLRLELSGIFNWALEGCLIWQRDGLGEPLTVQRATRRYREEEDVVGEFIEAYCRVDGKSWISTAELYQAFTSWWQETRGPHVRPPLPRWFGRALGERPELRSCKRKHVRGWRGVALLMEFR